MRKPIAICFIFSCAMSILAEPAPSAKEILESVRMKQSQQQIDLRGQLRQNNVVIPFQLIQSGGLVRYIFTDPDESLQLEIGEEDSRLDELSEKGVQKVAQFDRKIRGTDVSYEDIALKFLYWPNANVIGQENVRTRNCWKLQLRAPSKQSQYSSVLLWIDKNSGALMRLEGYDGNGQLAKKFEVISAQKIDNRWFLKQMRIEALQPGTNHVQSRTYLEIKK
ncbi:MAG: outer membrane lipoprotein-sorting protein [Spartobacteria bacterium]